MLGLSWSMVRSATGQFGQATWVSRFQHSVSTYDMLPTKNGTTRLLHRLPAGFIWCLSSSSNHVH